MGIFSKKNCSICNNPAGMVGREKLADGYVCKNCAADFSPFWSVWKSTTVREVQAHLNYRKQNRITLSRFNPPVRIGEENALWIDPASGLFALCCYQDFQYGNPDIFSLKDIRDCTYDIKMSQHRHDENTNDYYLYYFYLVIRLDSPNIRTARYRINPKAVHADKRPVLHDQIEQVYAGERELRGRMLSAFTGIDRKAAEQYLAYYSLLQDMIRALSDHARAQKNISVSAPSGKQQNIFSSDQPETPENNAAAGGSDIAASETKAMFCPWCGARRAAGAFCPSCGKKI